MKHAWWLIVFLSNSIRQREKLLPEEHRYAFLFVRGRAIRGQGSFYLLIRYYCKDQYSLLSRHLNAGVNLNGYKQLLQGHRLPYFCEFRFVKGELMDVRWHTENRNKRARGIPEDSIYPPAEGVFNTLYLFSRIKNTIVNHKYKLDLQQHHQYCIAVHLEKSSFH